MDVEKALRELYAEKKRLDVVIATLESRLRASAKQSSGKTSRRGRRSMNPADRQEVSRRMKDYWAAKRAEKAPVERETEEQLLEAQRASA